jgi:hypothetical protein
MNLWSAPAVPDPEFAVLQGWTARIRLVKPGLMDPNLPGDHRPAAHPVAFACCYVAVVGTAYEAEDPTAEEEDRLREVMPAYVAFEASAEDSPSASASADAAEASAADAAAEASAAAVAAVGALSYGRQQRLQHNKPGWDSLAYASPVAVAVVAAVADHPDMYTVSTNGFNILRLPINNSLHFPNVTFKNNYQLIPLVILNLLLLLLQELRCLLLWLLLLLELLWLLLLLLLELLWLMLRRERLYQCKMLSHIQYYIQHHRQIIIISSSKASKKNRM